MLTLLFGMFAFFWAAIFSVVGLTLFLGLIVPFLLLVVLFRIGFFIFKLAAGVVLLALFAVCLF
ncbi:MAG TPA: hypothetical protein VHU23_16235 [Rhizomicrobium sp.]|jgi:hypothetical protein|nr:hypothetical protein [Rhizomicrobium sp.]